MSFLFTAYIPKKKTIASRGSLFCMQQYKVFSTNYKLKTILLPLQADGKPMRQGEPVDDSGIGSGTAGNDEVNSHDVQRPQIDMKMRGQPRADAEKDGMHEVNRIGVIAEH